MWTIYGVAALGILCIAWLLLRRIQVPVLGPALFALHAAILFTPAKAISEQQDFIPALMVTLFDGIADGWPGVWHGAKPILLVYLGLLLLLLIGYAVRYAVAGRAKERSANETPE